MTQRLAGKVAVVTGGAARGIGSAVSVRLAREGAKVVIADVDAEQGEALAARLVGDGHEAVFLPTDATDYAAVAAAVDLAVHQFGRLDVYHAHGIAPYKRDYLSNISAAEWDDGVQAVLGTAFYGVRAALPAMLENPGGSIILTSSAASFGSQRGTGIYSVAKSAVNTLAMCVANEYGIYNIRCNAIAPGITGPGAAMSVTRTAYPTLEEWTAQQPLNRLIEAREVADLVCFLASDESSAITGTTIPVDAGFGAGKADFHGRPQFGQPWTTRRAGHQGK
ncbi:SDR family NAD(P)-dependent oxidoreductase [Streptomyces sp. NPDC059083]|uniref:SDR family NAD(P)-dependent oxidoreductase n=1 Tax=Streptomyces sp. NPDC059083 TaxID=3346721 RepID=UPI0036BF6A33